MKRKAVIIQKGKMFRICCDTAFLEEFCSYILEDEAARKEMRLIFAQITEGLKSPKFGKEPFGTYAMKPFKNNQNDRILCKMEKRKGRPACIVMVELYRHKTTRKVDKRLMERYKIIASYEYEIIE